MTKAFMNKELAYDLSISPFILLHENGVINDDELAKITQYLQEKFLPSILVSSKNLLKDNGVIFISIDDNEVFNLKLLCDSTIIIPNIVLEMSATPLNNHIDVEIEAQKVVDEGMIKEDVIVNQGINKEDKTLAEQDSEMAHIS